MVRAVANTLGGADVIETSLLLSAKDAAGPAAFDYFLQELTMPFEVHVNGTDRPAHAFSDPRAIEFPSPFGPRLGQIVVIGTDGTRAPLQVCLNQANVARRDSKEPYRPRCLRRGRSSPASQ